MKTERATMATVTLISDITFAHAAGHDDPVFDSAPNIAITAAFLIQNLSGPTLSNGCRKLSPFFNRQWERSW
jgi:hypothetical protein